MCRLAEQIGIRPTSARNRRHRVHRYAFTVDADVTFGELADALGFLVSKTIAIVVFEVAPLGCSHPWGTHFATCTVPAKIDALARATNRLRVVVDESVAVVVDAITQLLASWVNLRIRIVAILVADPPSLDRSASHFHLTLRIAITVAIAVFVYGDLRQPFIRHAVTVVVDAVADFGNTITRTARPAFIRYEINIGEGVARCRLKRRQTHRGLGAVVPGPFGASAIRDTSCKSAVHTFRLRSLESGLFSGRGVETPVDSLAPLHDDLLAFGEG
jgi:hypothetical protein